MGATKLIVYYSLFGITISPYLEFTEILTLFLNDLLYFIGMISFQVIFMFLMQPKKEFESISQGLNETLVENGLLKRIYSYAVNGVNLIVLACIWLLGIPFWIIFSKQPFLVYMWGLYILIGALAIITISHEVRRQWFIKFNVYPKMVYSNIARIFILLLVLTLISAFGEYYSVKNKKKYLGTIIILKDKVINSDSTYYFIGETKNFIFLHNDKNLTNDVIPLTEVKMLSIKSRP